MNTIMEAIEKVNKTKFCNMAGISRNTMRAVLRGDSVSTQSLQILYSTAVKVMPEKEREITTEITQWLFK